MAIVRLALGNPAANTDTLLYTASRSALVSVISTNKTATGATIRVWVQPSGTTLESQYAYMAYDTALPGSNSLETFRFSLINGDKLYVRSSTATVSFSLNGIYESNGTSNITTGTTYPVNPSIGDIFVNTTTSGVLYWNGTAWVNGTVDTSLYPFSAFQSLAPVYPVLGQIWVDADDNSTYVWSGSAWVATTAPGSSYQASEPSSPKIGQLWVDSDTSVQYVWTGSAWLALSNPDMVTLTGTQSLTNKTFIDAKSTVSINPQVASYIAAITDRDKLVEINSASANTFTVPLNSSVPFPIGSTINIVQTGAGQTTITPATAGVTINNTPGLKLRAQWSTATVIKRATDTWLAFGDIVA